MNDFRLRARDDVRVRSWHAWSIDFCVKKHMSDLKFDAFAFHFSLKKFTEDALATKPYQFHYQKLAARFPMANDVIEFCLANTLEDVAFIGNYTDDNHCALKSRWDIMAKTYRADCSAMAARASLDHLLKVNDRTYPLIIEMLQRKSVSLETVTIINLLTGFMDVANKKIDDTLLWPQIYLRVTKYGSFLRAINKELFREIILSEFGRVA